MPAFRVGLWRGPCFFQVVGERHAPWQPQSGESTTNTNENKKMLVVSTVVLALFAAGGSVASAALEVGAAVPEPAIAIIGVVGVMLLVRRRSVGCA